MKYIPKLQKGNAVVNNDLFEGLSKFVDQPSYKVVTNDGGSPYSNNCIGSVCNIMNKLGTNIPIITGNSNF